MFSSTWQDNSTHLWNNATQVYSLSVLQARSIQTQAKAQSSDQFCQRLKLGHQPSCIALQRLEKYYSSESSQQRGLLLHFIWDIVDFGTHSDSDLRLGQRFPVLGMSIIRYYVHIHTHSSPEQLESQLEVQCP